MDSILNKKIENKYKLIKKLGEGSFGQIFQAEQLITGEKFAIKFESRRGQDLLENEGTVMNFLKGPGIPFIKEYLSFDDYNMLVMQLLGKSLEDILCLTKTKTFSVKTTCNLASQMLSILEYIHNRHIVHRDIKPDNFVMGIDDKKDLVHLLDFGLARKFRSSRTLEHYPMVNKKRLVGTARYASINALLGYEQSRRDDLESLGYVLMYFLRGSLPWQGLPTKNKEERYLKIMEKKKEITAKILCQNFPVQFETFVDYTRRLSYEEDPKYDYLKGLFQEACFKNNLGPIDKYFDWFNESETNELSNKLSDFKDVGNIKITDIDKEKKIDDTKQKLLPFNFMNSKSPGGLGINYTKAANVSSGNNLSIIAKGSNISNQEGEEKENQYRPVVSRIPSQEIFNKEENDNKNKAQENNNYVIQADGFNIDIKPDVRNDKCCCNVF